MVGAGAIAGTLSGGYTNAARSPDTIPAGVLVDLGPAVVEAATEAPAEYTQSNTSAVAMTSVGALRAKSVPPNAVTPVASNPVASSPVASKPVANEPAPTAVIATRFPSQWQQQRARAASGDNDAPTQSLAYAAEPQAVEPVRPAAASSGGFPLASVDTNANPEPAAMPKRMARPEKPKPAVLFNDAQLASIKARLRLTRDQEQYWPQVESALRAISWKLATQQKGIVRGNQAQTIDPSSPEVARLKSAAFPLIMSMREDQKQEVRQLAHTMGLKQVAAMF